MLLRAIEFKDNGGAGVVVGVTVVVVMATVEMVACNEDKKMYTRTLLKELREVCNIRGELNYKTKV